MRIPIYELPSLRCGFYDDYVAIMTRELQQFEKLDVSVDGSDTYLEKVRKDCNELVVKLHAIGQGWPTRRSRSTGRSPSPSWSIAPNFALN